MGQTDFQQSVSAKLARDLAIGRIAEQRRQDAPCEIILSAGMVALVDAEDYAELSKYNWIAAKRTRTCYAMRVDRSSGKQVGVYMHRQTMNTPDGMEADHIDGNGMNNRRANLRNVTPHQNRTHRVNPVAHSSKYTGVHKVEGVGKNSWRAQVTVKRVKRALGCFATEDAAARAYNAAALEAFGEFAHLNDVPDYGDCVECGLSTTVKNEDDEFLCESCVEDVAQAIASDDFHNDPRRA